MGYPASATGRRKSLQKVFSNEVADETRSLEEDESLGERDGARFWHSGDPVKVFGTVLVQRMLLPRIGVAVQSESALESIVHFMSGRSAAW